MSVVVHVNGENSADWCQQLQVELPELPCETWTAVGDATAVTIAAVWEPPRGGLAKFPNLRCVVSLAAGVDHIIQDPDLPPELPVLRLAGEPLRARMREYVALHVLALHRGTGELLQQQQHQNWSPAEPEIAAARRVGIVGLGELGRECAVTLCGLGFDVAGWSRSRKQIDGVASFAGTEELPRFLARSEILVNLLPLTPMTAGMFNMQLFTALPSGAGFINAGRGGHVVDSDLLAALSSGQLRAAVLDAFTVEPLPVGHPFWRHPRIWVTPHVAASLGVKDAVQLAARAIRKFLQGERSGMVDRQRGY